MEPIDILTSFTLNMHQTMLEGTGREEAGSRHDSDPGKEWTEFSTKSLSVVGSWCGPQLLSQVSESRVSFASLEAQTPWLCFTTSEEAGIDPSAHITGQLPFTLPGQWQTSLNARHHLGTLQEVTHSPCEILQCAESSGLSIILHMWIRTSPCSLGHVYTAPASEAPSPDCQT